MYEEPFLLPGRIAAPIRITIPSVDQAPTHKPRVCVYCGQPILQHHGIVSKSIKGHRLSRVIAHRYKCLSCGRTFRDYPPGSRRRTRAGARWPWRP